jgi:polyisoprenoid-binding protein YceI
MKKAISVALIIFSACMSAQTVASQNSEWLVSSAVIKFKIKNAGFTVDGTFGALGAKIIFDETKNYGNSIETTIDSKTINTKNNTRDGHLKKAEYFDVEKYPKIVMKATLFGKENNGSFRGYFKLTIKDKTKDILVPFTFFYKDGKGVFVGTFTINRLDFGVGESSMILSDKATINLEVNVIKK